MVELSFLLVASLAVLITGISKSGFAGGLGVITVPMMSVFVAPQMAVAIMIPILLVMDAANVWRYRNHWSPRVVLILLPGAAVGTGLGALSFEALHPDVLRGAIGVLALVYVAQAVLLPRPATDTRPPPAWGLFGVSLISGYAGFVALAGGPPIKGYLLRLCPEKSEFVGTNSVFFAAANLMKAVLYGALGQYSLQTATLSLSLVPALILGVVLGFRLHNVISQTVFMRLSYGLLTLAGLRLLYDALT